MFFSSGKQFQEWSKKAITLVGMSGTGKTHISNYLRHVVKGWYHYSIDYRIGTRYMNEHIAHAILKEAARHPVLKNLMCQDAVNISPNLCFNNLAALSYYLGKPGDVNKGGIDVETYKHRQEQHRLAELQALEDVEEFITKSRDIYGYNNFICDSSGSICEVVNPLDKQDKILGALFNNTLILYIETNKENETALIERFNCAPKPMYYDKHTFSALWKTYCLDNDVIASNVDPDDFTRWGFERLIHTRLEKYHAIAQHWGYTVRASDLAQCQTYAHIEKLICDAIDTKTQSISNSRAII